MEKLCEAEYKQHLEFSKSRKQVCDKYIVCETAVQQ